MNTKHTPAHLGYAARLCLSKIRSGRNDGAIRRGPAAEKCLRGVPGHVRIFLVLREEERGRAI